jgi:RNA polymerase sigma-70 factor, ECF subfamily
LLAVLDPGVVIRADRGTLRVVRGARAVAEGALTFSRFAEFARPALVNGAPGIVSWLPGGQSLAVMGFTVTRGKIVEIDALADPGRLRKRRPRVPVELQKLIAEMATNNTDLA